MPDDAAGSQNGQVVNSDPRIVTLWSDIGCPWATLALRTLRAAARKRGQELLIDHRAFPLELFNRMPTPKFILDAEIVAVAALRTELGWQSWAGPESEYPVTTLPAMEAVQAAKDPAVGGLPASDQLDGALREAFYVDGRCISIHPVILEIAENCDRVDENALADALASGSGRAEIYQDWKIAQGPDIQGSPHLFGTDGYAVHNPGATYHWTGKPGEGGFPRFESYDSSWTKTLLDLVA